MNSTISKPDFPLKPRFEEVGYPDTTQAIYSPINANLRLTQSQKILNILSDGKYHCSSYFHSNYIPEYRSLINKLRKKGYLIETTDCTLHNYHDGHPHMWIWKNTNKDDSEFMKEFRSEFMPIKEIIVERKGLF